jgi:predicted hotdog family 3-hydroxylacyl-ACP dehydratase
MSLVTKEEITQYIPQKPPIVMIDTIEVCAGETTVTTFRVEAANIFTQSGHLREPGIIENIAQTAAAKAGYEVKKLGKEPLVGFIGAVKDLKIHALPAVGDTLSTSVDVKNQVMYVNFINGRSQCGERLIAECEMKIFIQKPSDVQA